VNCQDSCPHKSLVFEDQKQDWYWNQKDNCLHNIPKNGMGLVPMGSHGGIGLVTICSHGGIAMGLALIMDFCGITKGFMRMI